MAQKVQIILEDDLDGSEANETVSFSLDGVSYEIDLNDANAAKLRDALGVYIGHARKVTAARRSAGRRTPSAGGPSAKDVREWARDNGHTVPDRGRIPAEVRSAYDAAH